MPHDASFAATLRIRDRCLCLHLQRAARKAARHFDEALRPLDLTSGQFSLLNALNRPQPARIGAVAALLGMDRTTLTAALKPLERRGLVASAADPEDRRSRTLVLTREGKASLAAAIPIWTRSHARLERLLEGGDADALRRDLLALSRGQGGEAAAAKDARLRKGKARRRAAAPPGA